MKLTKEQISQLRKQLFEQIKHLPENQKREAEEQIENLSDEAIESMLKNQKGSQPNIFREIVSGKISSKKVEENEEAIAVLDIRPLSRGHVIIIPKHKIDNIDKIPKSIINFSEEISKKLSSKLNTNKVKIIPEIKFGETIINVVPVYDEDISLESERSETSEEDLDKILDKITKKSEVKEKKEIIEEKKEIIKLKRRIP